jgi:hypothetical protein
VLFEKKGMCSQRFGGSRDVTQMLTVFHTLQNNDERRTWPAPKNVVELCGYVQVLAFAQGDYAAMRLPECNLVKLSNPRKFNRDVLRFRLSQNVRITFRCCSGFDEDQLKSPAPGLERGQNGLLALKVQS